MTGELDKSTGNSARTETLLCSQHGAQLRTTGPVLETEGASTVLAFERLTTWLWILLSPQHIKKQRHYFANKDLSSQGYGFSSGHVWMWELDHKESWAPKNWCFWIGVLEKTLVSPLDCKEIQPVHPKGNQSWIFIGRTDAEAETTITWPPDVKSWLLRKDPDAGKDWRQEEMGTTKDEMVGWHHWLNGHEFELALGIGDGQGSLACCSSWGRKESATTEWLNWTELSPHCRRARCEHLAQGSLLRKFHQTETYGRSPSFPGIIGKHPRGQCFSKLQAPRETGKT